jgi:phosphoribosylaminoimidazole-succinocarboxamide synthase
MSIENQCILGTDFQFDNQKHLYKGKVRDVYTIGDKLVMVATDRISSFDHILPRPIPYKGQVLNEIASYFIKKTEDICPNWIENIPDPNVAIGKACEPIRVEMVIRGYLTGHAWRTYQSGLRILCGITLPEGMKEHDKFPTPIITPATKAEEGHDEDISREDILSKGIVPENIYIQLEDYTRKIFQRGTEMAAKQGLILVDTKYEFGLFNGEVVLIDEIHTPDSSRYFYAEGYEERQAKGETQQQLSKEFVREWLMDNNFRGLEGQTMPIMPDDFVWEVSNRYIELYEIITGLKFVKHDNSNVLARIEENVNAYLK